MADLVKHRKLYGEVLNSLIKKQFSVEVPVYGLSMFPFYLPGDRVVIVDVKKCDLRVGDVIVFTRNGRLIAHRLLKINFLNESIISKGDGLVKYDDIVYFNELQAVVIEHYRKKREIKWGSNPRTKRVIAYLSPYFGMFTFYLGRAWFKILK